VNGHRRKLMLGLMNGMKWGSTSRYGRTSSCKRIIQSSFKKGFVKLRFAEAHRPGPRLPFILSCDPKPLDMGQSMTRVTTMTVLMPTGIRLVGEGRYLNGWWGTGMETNILF